MKEIREKMIYDHITDGRGLIDLLSITIMVCDDIAIDTDDKEWQRAAGKILSCARSIQERGTIT